MTLQITVNVYDLHESNNALHTVGMGIYHTGVQIKEYEYSFSDEGISRTLPRLLVFGQFREQIVMGTFSGSISDVNRVIETLSQSRFAPGMYNLTTNNCNHFSDALCFSLVDVNIPTWINRVAGIGSSILPSSALKTNHLDAHQKSGNFAAPGAAKKPSEPLPTQKLVDSRHETCDTDKSWVTSLFNWFDGGTTTTTTTTSSVTTTNNVTSVSSGTTYRKDSSKKELTPKQRELLLKIKEKA